MMVIVALVSLGLGILFGQFCHASGLSGTMDTIMSYTLIVMILSVGIEIGSNKTIFKQIREKGFKILLIPLGTLIGSIGAGLVVGLFFNEPVNVSATVSCGMGFSTLTTVIVKELAGTQVATINFLSNILREMLSFLLIPIVAKKIGKYPAVSVGGATTMDTTLPSVSRSTDGETALIAVISGAVLTAAAPVLIPILYQI